MSIWGAIGTAVGAYFGPAGAAVGGSIGGAVDANNANAASAEQAQAFSAQQYATRYQTTVKDLEAAGLSPMLAYSQGAGSPPTGVTYQSQNVFANAAQAYQQYQSGESSSSQSSLNKASADKVRSETRLVDETVNKTKQEISNLETTQEQAKAVIDNLRETRQNLVKEGYNLTEQGNVLHQTFMKLREEIPYISSNTFLNTLESQLKQYDVQAARDTGNIGRSAGQFKPFVDMVTSIIRSSRR